MLNGISMDFENTDWYDCMIHAFYFGLSITHLKTNISARVLIPEQGSINTLISIFYKQDIYN